MGLGHCCGSPVSHGCWGLASEAITKAPLGLTLSKRPQRPFFLLRGPSSAHRSAIPPKHLQEFRRNGPQVFRRNGQTCRRHSSRACGLCPRAPAPCERSRLVRRYFLGMPYRLWRLSLECLIAFGGGIYRLCLVYPRVMSNSHVRSRWISLLYTWTFSGWSAMSLSIR